MSLQKPTQQRGSQLVIDTSLKRDILSTYSQLEIFDQLCLKSTNPEIMSVGIFSIIQLILGEGQTGLKAGGEFGWGQGLGRNKRTSGTPHKSSFHLEGEFQGYLGDVFCHQALSLYWLQVHLTMLICRTTYTWPQRYKAIFLILQCLA